MDINDQNEPRRKRMRIHDKDQTDDNADSPSSMKPDLVADTIFARNMAMELESGHQRKHHDAVESSAADSTADPAAVSQKDLARPELEHPDEGEVRAAYARGEHQTLFSLLGDFDKTSTHNQPLQSARPAARLTRSRRGMAGMAGRGIGYGGTDHMGMSDYTMDGGEDEMDPNAVDQSALAGQGLIFAGSTPPASGDAPVMPPAKKTSSGSWIKKPKKYIKKHLGISQSAGAGAGAASPDLSAFYAWNTLSPYMPGPPSKPFYGSLPPSSTPKLPFLASGPHPPDSSASPHSLPPIPSYAPGSIMNTPAWSAALKNADGGGVPKLPTHESHPPTAPTNPDADFAAQQVAQQKSLFDVSGGDASSDTKPQAPPSVVSKTSSDQVAAQNEAQNGPPETKSDENPHPLPPFAVLKSHWGHFSGSPQVSQESGHMGLGVDANAPPGRIWRKVQFEEIPPEKPIVPDEDDLMTTRVFAQITALLQANDKPEADQSVATSSALIPSIIRCSTLLDRVANLLRHSALQEMIGKPDMYQKLHDFICALAKHPQTACMIFEDRISHRPGHNITDLAQGRPTAGISDLTASSLFQCMQPMAQIIDLELNNPDIESISVELLLPIKTTHEWLSSQAAPSIAEVTDPDAWQAELRFAQVPDEIIMSNHSLALTPDAPQTAPPPKRMARIAKEIKDLRTNLPHGIFVRCAESRPDIMKILILGPDSTPYEHGIFEFDLIYPADFPFVPPKMKFRTTGHGRISFNPNLYADGKVCLSILGTWSGEPWRVSSTTRQVLLSIQAMIFCDQPWRNEPGREAVSDDDPHLEIYNQTLRPWTVQYAMLEWMEGGPAKDPTHLWADVVRRHFAAREREIRSCVALWTRVVTSKGKGVVGSGWGGGKSGEGGEVVESEAVEEEEGGGGGLLAYLKRVLPALQANQVRAQRSMSMF